MALSCRGMSKLRHSSGDDHPDAAGMHLEDARALQGAKRWCSACYHAGYVVECALKSVLLPENKLSYKHELATLKALVDQAVMGKGSARYVGPAVAGLLSTPLAAWTVEMRYRPSTHSQDQQEVAAGEWLAAADALYQETVARMWKDGLL